MSVTLTIEVSDELLQRLRQSAERQGKSTEAVRRRLLGKLAIGASGR